MRRNSQLPLIFYLTAFIFGIMVISAALIYGLWMVGTLIGVYREDSFGIAGLLLAGLICSVVISTLGVYLLGNQALFSSVRQLSQASKRVAEGDFSMRLPLPKEREMGELVKNFNNMVEQLGRQELLANDFISSVSHEFRNPLSAIRGYAQLLESDALTPAQRKEYVGVISEKTTELSSLVNSILELSRLDNGCVSLIAAPFSLDEQLRKTILMMSDGWSAKSIEFDPELPPVTYVGNKELIGEIWQNLVDNAIKYTGEGGHIRVCLKKTEKTVSVTVADTGVGMDEQTKKRIFDKFFQAEPHGSGRGNGLGLSIVRRIVDLIGGHISIDSIQGQGTTVLVELPITQPVAS